MSQCVCRTAKNTAGYAFCPVCGSDGPRAVLGSDRVPACCSDLEPCVDPEHCAQGGSCADARWAALAALCVPLDREVSR